MVKDYNAKIIEIKELTSSVRLFTLDLNEEFEFNAGQFVSLSQEINGETIRRGYSIASPPDNSSKIELCIKHIKGGKMTTELFKKKVEDSVIIKGPLGIFTLDKGTKEKLVFIGTGTGIAPLRSMILDELKREKELLNTDKNEGVINSKQIQLIFGVRYENEILFKEEFEKLEQENSNFKFIPIISRPTENWNGRKGHVQDNFDIIDVINSNVFMCGLPLMINEAREKLIEMGMDEKDIFHEVFSK